MSKGSNRRPRFVPLAELESAWERTFGKQERYAPPGVRYTQPSTAPEIQAMLDRHPIRLTEAERDAFFAPSSAPAHDAE